MQDVRKCGLCAILLTLGTSACGDGTPGRETGHGSEPALGGTDTGGLGSSTGGQGVGSTAGSDTGGSGEDDDTGTIRFDLHVPGHDGNGVGCRCPEWDENFVPTLWASNSPEHTVSRINTRTLQEEGRYITHHKLHGNPSRTSVSFGGRSVAVANRWGGVIKIWAWPELCDPNANGVPGLQTSQGANDVLEWGTDDCVAWYIPFDYVSQRPIAWAPPQENEATKECSPEKLWTAGCASKAPKVEVVRIDGNTGTIEATLEIDMSCSGLGGYGGASDAYGNFWVSQLGSGVLARVDFDTLQSIIYPYPDWLNGYGITVDHQNRVWIVGGTVGMFDPVSEQWTKIKAPGGFGVMEDAQQRVWIADSEGLHWVDSISFQAGAQFDMDHFGKGVSVDMDGYIWHVGNASTDNGSAYRLDSVAGIHDAYTGLNQPYTYSDMTGWGLQNTLDPSWAPPG